MPIPATNLTPIAPEAKFIALVKNILVQLEGRRPRPYLDTSPSQYITIGIGFNVDIPDHRSRLAAEMGIPAASLHAAWAHPQMATIRAIVVQRNQRLDWSG